MSWGSSTAAMNFSDTPPANKSHSIQALNAGLTRSLTLPYADIKLSSQGYHADKGLMLVFYSLLAKGLNATLNIEVIDRADIVKTLTEGQTDFHCELTPAWLGPHQEDVLWSDVYMETQNLLISRYPAPLIRSEADFNNLLISTTSNYRYPTLAEHFAEGRLKRIDAADDQQTFMTLFQDSRIDAAILKDIYFNYLYRKLPRHHRPTVIKHPYVIETIESRCALSKSSPLKLETLNQAINNINEQQLLTKYLDEHDF